MASTDKRTVLIGSTERISLHFPGLPESFLMLIAWRRQPLQEENFKDVKVSWDSHRTWWTRSARDKKEELKEIIGATGRGFTRMWRNRKHSAASSGCHRKTSCSSFSSFRTTHRSVRDPVSPSISSGATPPTPQPPSPVILLADDDNDDDDDHLPLRLTLRSSSKTLFLLQTRFLPLSSSSSSSAAASLFSFFFLFQTSDFREKDFLLHVFELKFTSHKSSKIGFDTATRQERREKKKETPPALRRQTWNSRKLKPQKASSRRKTKPIFFF